MKMRFKIILMLVAILIGFSNFAIAQQNGFDVTNQLLADKKNDPNNPPPHQDPKNHPGRIVEDMTCNTPVKITTPGNWSPKWSCTTNVTCSCNVKVRNDNARFVICRSYTQNIVGNGSNTDRNQCIAEGDRDADAQRDAFFQSCRNNIGVGCAEL